VGRLGKRGQWASRSPTNCNSSSVQLASVLAKVPHPPASCQHRRCTARWTQKRAALPAAPPPGDTLGAAATRRRAAAPPCPRAALLHWTPSQQRLAASLRTEFCRNEVPRCPAYCPPPLEGHWGPTRCVGPVEWQVCSVLEDDFTTPWSSGGPDFPSGVHALTGQSTPREGQTVFSPRSSWCRKARRHLCVRRRAHCQSCPNLVERLNPFAGQPASSSCPPTRVC